MQKLLSAVEYSDTQHESLTAFNTALSLSDTNNITNDDIIAAVNNTLLDNEL